MSNPVTPVAAELANAVREMTERSAKVMLLGYLIAHLELETVDEELHAEINEWVDASQERMLRLLALSPKSGR